MVLLQQNCLAALGIWDEDVVFHMENVHDRLLILISIASVWNVWIFRKPLKLSHLLLKEKRFLGNGLLNDITFTEQIHLREHWDPSLDNNFCQDLCRITQNCFSLSFTVTGRALSQHQVCQNSPNVKHSPIPVFLLSHSRKIPRTTESAKKTADRMDLCWIWYVRHKSPWP